MAVRTVCFCVVSMALAGAGAFGGECEVGWDQSIGTPGVNGWVYAIHKLEYQGKQQLFIAGTFSQVNGIAANSVARWDGSTWSALGNGFDQRVLALAVFDSGNGPELYAGGAWTTPANVKNIAKWNEAAQKWEQVGGGVDGGVISMAVFDDGTGPALYAGGDFQYAGGVAAQRIARWDGSTWSAVGSGADGTVRSMVVFDDGAGPGLYLGGNFATINGMAAGRVIRYESGGNWSLLGTGLSGVGIRSMEVFDDGSGPQLYVGGVFTHAGGMPVGSIARWNFKDQAWLGMGGVNERVVIMRAFDDGNGPRLYIGGWFTLADGMPIHYVGAWDGAAWSELGSGANMVVRSMAAFDDGNGLALYVGGAFTQMDGEPSAGIVRWTACHDDVVLGDMDGNGVVDVTDLLLLLGAWGDCSAGEPCDEDLTGDSVVDVSDLLLLLGNWG